MLPRLAVGFALALSVATVAAQAPADRWTHFRGMPSLLGTSVAAIPDQLRVLWTYDAGEAIESSAAIADGVVYVGAQPGELHAVNLSDGKMKWKYKASELGLGESSPAVANGIVYVGDLGNVLHAVDAASGKAVWTFKTGSEIKSSPVVVGDRVLIGSYDSHLYALGAKDGKLLWKVQTQGYVHGTPPWSTASPTSPGATRSCPIRINDGKEVFATLVGRLYRRFARHPDGRAYYGPTKTKSLPSI